jgi:isocitrate dehydrogenase kinase/phosphatase
MPHKRLAELYIALGYHKHGKTELYRDLLKHQRTCSLDRFDFAPGEPGMVMIAFNMPNDDLIYKLIRDRFASPKKTSAQQVMEKYEYVFHHDRVGRLLDVQTFEHLELEDCCFTSRLLQEISQEAKQAATVSQGHVVLEHAYVERRVTPLDIYLTSVDGPSAAAVVLDYGQAIKDLAQANIFPGDMLVKNFGVTNMGRVVFYDYDELRPLTECNFRQLPQARQYEDDLDADPWFMVAENDVFPAEFAVFLGLPNDLRRIFLTRHKDLLAPEFWWQTQDQIRSGTWVHIRPYGEAQRLYPGA